MLSEIVIRSIIREEITKIIVEDLLDEFLRKRVFRRGKLRRKLFCPKPMKSSPDGLRCVPMKAPERMKRKVATRKAAKKRKAKAAIVRRKTRKAMKKRKAFGLNK